MTTLIAPDKNLGYSNIYLDFLAGKATAGEFYPAHDIKEVAAQLGSVSYDREQLAKILTEQNKLYDASDKTFARIDELKQPSAVAVFSGQQAVLFGGPMLIMIKALTLIKTADEYSRRLNRPVVPIFWIAGDDHDFAEVNHTTVLSRQTEEVVVRYDSPPELEISTSEIKFTNADELENAKSKFKEALGQTDFTPKLFDIIDRSYQAGETLVTAFGKLMAALIADYGLVLFCPGDKTVKQHAIPFFKKLIEVQDALHDLVGSTNKKIIEKGYHLQVEKADNSTHLFYNINGRKPIIRENNNFTVGSKTFSRDEILNLIEKEPENFSPDVLTRPVFQSFLFPVISQRGGPAEIAYLAQINPIFGLFELPAPVYKSRPSVTLIEKHFEKMMNEYEIKFDDLIGDIEQVINRVLSKSFPDDLEKDFEMFRKNIEAQFESFKKDSLDFDPSLKEFAKQTYGKIDYALKNFEGKVFSSHKKKSQDVRDRIYRLWHTLFPSRGLQERTLNISYFLSKYGFDFIKFLHDYIDADETSHQLISVTDYKQQ